jgi:hypothetical protein
MFLFFITPDDPVEDTTSVNCTVAHRFMSLADRSHGSSDAVKVPTWTNNFFAPLHLKPLLEIRTSRINMQCAAHAVYVASSSALSAKFTHVPTNFCIPNDQVFLDNATHLSRQGPSCFACGGLVDDTEAIHTLT